jgi:ribose/xylose/arabinose/galactoside ABC-type transport system permease subunit
MTAREAAAYIILFVTLAEFFSFLASMITYFGILQGIENNPMNPQNILDFGNWLVEFIKGQIYGIPISLFITIIIAVLRGEKPEF